jgi:hypothetical protein
MHHIMRHMFFKGMIEFVFHTLLNSKDKKKGFRIH